MFEKLFGKSGGGAKAKTKINNPVIPDNYDDFLELAFNHAQALMQAHTASWHIDQADNFSADIQAGSLEFYFPDGKLVKAPAELIGTWNGQDETFLWGWDHPSAPDGSAKAAAALKKLADEKGFEKLQSSKISVGFDDSWGLAAAAVLAGNLQGLYRFQASATAWAYLGFGNVTISKK